MVIGWAWTVLLNGTVGLAAYWTARYGFRQPAGEARTLAGLTLAWIWITLGMIILGVQGWLGRGPLLLWAAALLLLAAFPRHRHSRQDENREESPARGVVGRAAIVALGLFAWAAVLLGVASTILAPALVSDGPVYHLYSAIRWWKAGRLFLIAMPFGDPAATYFPAGGDLWLSWLIVGLGSDHLARIGQAPFLLMAGLAVYALSRLLAVGATAALIAAVWFMTCHTLMTFSFEANVDTIFVAGYLTSVFFGLRYAHGENGSSSLVLAALAAGAAWGTRPTSTIFIV
ncbi:MAG: glycosyltransferase family 39 protein, partial [Isosphaeraceae bacterium]